MSPRQYLEREGEAIYIPTALRGIEKGKTPGRSSHAVTRSGPFGDSAMRSFTDKNVKAISVGNTILTHQAILLWWLAFQKYLLAYSALLWWFFKHRCSHFASCQFFIHAFFFLQGKTESKRKHLVDPNYPRDKLAFWDFQNIASFLLFGRKCEKLSSAGENPLCKGFWYRDQNQSAEPELVLKHLLLHLNADCFLVQHRCSMSWPRHYVSPGMLGSVHCWGWGPCTEDFMSYEMHHRAPWHGSPVGGAHFGI